MDIFKEFFSSPNNPLLITNRTTKVTDVLNNGSVIYLCFFHLLSSSKSGAIHYNTEANILICNCVFSQCYSDNNGGAVSCIGPSIQTVQKHICGYKCHSGTFGQLFYMNLSPSKINYLIESSITMCSYLITSTGDSHEFHGGDPNITSLNSSSNTGRLYIGISFVGINKGKASFCMVSNNLIGDSICIEMWGSNGVINLCNVINNTQLTYNNGVILATLSSNLVLKQCVLLNNTRNVLFCTISGSITIDGVFSDDFSSTRTNPTFLETFGTTSPYQFTFYSTAFCETHDHLPPTIFRSLDFSILVLFTSMFYII